MFGRNEQHVDPTKAATAKRVSKLPTRDLLDWADVAGSGVARALDDYRRGSRPESLEDARQGLQQLLAVVEALQSRTSSG